MEILAKKKKNFVEFLLLSKTWSKEIKVELKAKGIGFFMNFSHPIVSQEHTQTIIDL